MTDDSSAPGDVGHDDRRSLLTKAALVGGVAWVAPVVLSQQAAAAGTLPPACAGLTLNPGDTVQVPPCGQIQVIHANVQFGIYVINGAPINTPVGTNPAPTITSVTVSVPIASKTGEGTTSVTIRLVDPADVPSFCVIYDCSPPPPPPTEP